EREAGLLQGLDVAADGALGDAVLVGQVLRGRVAPGLDPLEDPPLANDFGVTHDSDPLRSQGNGQATDLGGFGGRGAAPPIQVEDVVGSDWLLLLRPGKGSHFTSTSSRWKRKPCPSSIPSFFNTCSSSSRS